MVTPHIKIDDREFNRTLRAYMEQTKRTLPEILNQKAYSISMAATKLTYKASFERIRGELGVVASKLKVNKTGKRKGKFSRGGKVYAGQESGGAPFLAKIINAARGRRGEKGLQGAEMKAAMKKVYNARVGAIGFIRSGWLPAVAAFARAIGKPVKSRTEKWLQRTAMSIGGARPAKPGPRPLAVFWNSATARPENTNTKDVYKYAKEGLQAAMNQEVGRMKQHMEDKLQRQAAKFAARR